MGDWDDSDDDWDKEDDEESKAKFAKELKERERKVRNRERGLDSDYESEEEVVPVVPTQTVPAVPKQKTKKQLREEEGAKEEEPELDSEALKLRQRELEEEANELMAMELMGGCSNSFAGEKKAKEKKAAEEKAAKEKAAAAKAKVTIIDQFDSLSLNVQNDVSELSKTCCEKLTKGKCKGGPQKFLTDLIRTLEFNMSTLELNNLEKLLTDTVKEKKKPVANSGEKEKKAKSISKNTKFNQSSEWEDVYNVGDEWTKEEWDAWEAEDAAKNAAAQQKATQPTAKPQNVLPDDWDKLPDAKESLAATKKADPLPSSAPAGGKKKKGGR